MSDVTAKRNGGIGGFFKGVRSEFKKVVWPSFDVLMKQTLTVSVVSLIIGLLVSGIDKVFGAIVNLLLG